MLVATGLPSETSSVSFKLPRVVIDPYKRALDILVAGSALLFFAPVLLLVGVLIKLESRGPMLFRQARGGLNGEAFTIFKFRSMRCEENGDRVVQAARDDDRVTKIGRFIRKTSIDELPQLVNVLMGDMSIVGLRPHALAHDVEYAAVIPRYSLRFRAKPGLTGLAQIKGLRGGTNEIQAMAARVEADVEYIERWTFGSDIRILLLTLPHLLVAENA